MRPRFRTGSSRTKQKALPQIIRVPRVKLTIFFTLQNLSVKHGNSFVWEHTYKTW